LTPWRLLSSGFLAFVKVSTDIATGKKPEALRRDIDAMLHFPGDFGCFDMMTCSVDKQSTICVKGCHYSVPDSLVGQTVTVQLYSENCKFMTLNTRKWPDMNEAMTKGPGILISTTIWTR